MPLHTSLSLLASGDSIITRAVPFDDPGFAALIEVLGQADARFTNLELTCPRLPFVPGVRNHGVYIAASPAVLDDLRRMGFNLFGTANNHFLDYSPQGVADTLDALDSRGLAHAGAGRNLTEARQPAYVDTAGRRVALLAANSTAAATILAADPEGPIGGRAGVSPLRFSAHYGIAPEDLARLAAVDEAIGTAAATRRAREFGTSLGGDELDPTSLRFLGFDFVTTAAPGIHTTPHRGDVDALLRWAREARRQADIVAVSLHCHEGAAGQQNSPAPPEFLVETAHALIDGGVDVILGHGPHQLRGIEAYKGGLIFYSLGNLFFELETIANLPRECLEQEGLGPESTASDFQRHWAAFDDGRPKGFYASPAFWESVVALVRFDTGETVSAELWPIDLGFRLPPLQRGLPRLARGEAAREILVRLKELSGELGTHIELDRTESTWVGRVSAQVQSLERTIAPLT